MIIRATDESGSISLQQFTVQVTAPNSAPVITSNAPTVGFVGRTFAYDVLAQDTTGDALTFAIVSGAAGATIDSAGRLRWTPAAGDAGNVNFEIEVADSAGNTASQFFTVAVSADQPVATPFVITSPRTTVGLGQPYLARVAGTDQLDRALEFSLVSGPTGLTVDSDGTIQWSPGSDDLGEQTVELLATNVDGETESFEFTLTVVGRPVINSPVIESTPTLSAVVGNEYQYNLAANDPDGDVLSFELVDAPDGLTIDSSRGTIRWTPQADQIGQSNVTVEVTDPDGATATQTFTLRVSRAGGPPIITSIPTTEVNVGGSFLYSVIARDAEGDPLNYRLLEAPEGATISSTTGEISWTPTADQLGQQVIVIEVSDGFGGAATQAFSVLVGDGIVNLPPQLDSVAPRFTAVGSDYEYQIIATDPEATALSYAVSRGPDGLTVDANGLVTWTPAANQTGQFVVTLVITDAGGASTVESFELDVLAENRAPVINSSAPAELFAGEEFQYDLLVTDADFDPLQFELVTGPDGASIDGFGRLRWTTDNDSIGPHDFEVRVTDPRGGEATQSFTLNVVADTLAPTLLLSDLNDEDNRNVLPWQGPIRVFARAADNVGVASLTLSVNGVDTPLDANGQAAFEFDDFQFSNINVVATAIDVNGNVTTRSTDVDFDFPEGFTGANGEVLPTAIITSPADSSTATGFVPIIGTATHEAFAAYELLYRRVDQSESEFVTFFESETAVENGELGVWDTSLLRNDEYVIRLQVATNTGVVNVVEHNVGLSGELKLGNFQLAFTDLVIPVAGIPIEITRVYDTLDADIEGEFGFGWRLDFRDTNLQVGVPASGLEDIGIYSPLRPGVKVYLNIPGEGRQGFTFNPEIRVLPSLGGDDLVLARPRFTPDPGVTSTLSTGVNSFLTVNERGELFAGGVPYNPAASEFGGAFVLTTAEGITYRIDGASGQLDTATDRNGNVVTFSDTGIGSELIGNVIFERDTQNRISSISDLEGNLFIYRYDATGNLASVIDREGNETRFIYSNEIPHFLETVVDPLGREGIRTEYDEDGRLIATIDALGNRISTSYDVDNSLFIIRDQLGSPTTFEYDLNGNVVATTNALGATSRLEYDSNGNITSQEDPLGNITTFTYDRNGNLATTRLSDNSIVSTRFDSSGQLTESIDALGNVRQSEFDSSGNISSATTPDGNTSTFDTDSRGNTTRITFQDGSVVRMSDFFGSAATTTINNLGATFENNFDANGNTLQTIETFEDGGVERVRTTTIERDAEGRVTRETNSLGEVIEFSYDANGNLIQQRDALARLTQFVYDSRNQLIETIFPDGTSFEQQYDAIGRVISETDQDGVVTHFVYDAVGNLTSTILPDATPDDLSDNPRLSSEFDRAGRFVSQTDANGNRTEFQYNELGSLVATVNAMGFTTSNEFDAEGRLVRTVDEIGRIVEFQYDARGQVTSQTDSLGTTQSTRFGVNGRIDEILGPYGEPTRYEYGPLSQLTAVIDAEGNRTEYEYNGDGNLVITTDALGRQTKLDYDILGRLTRETLPSGAFQQFTYDSVGRLTSEVDFNGIETVFTYDLLDRIVDRSVDGVSLARFTYTNTGLRNSAIDERGITSYEYDERNRLVRETAPNQLSIAYQYDQNSNLTAISTSSGTTNYTYNSLDLLTNVISATGDETSYVYDGAGNAIRTELPNGLFEESEFDARDLLTQKSTFRDGTLVAQINYTRDIAGQPTEIRYASGAFQEFEYNNLGSIELERYTDATGEVRETTYTYDADGNRIHSADTDLGSRTYIYDENNQLIRIDSPTETIEFTYDLNGNRTSRTSNDGNQEFTFNAEGRLARISSVIDGTSSEIENTYDVDGVLVQQIEDGVTTNFVVSTQGALSQILESYDQNLNLLSKNEYGLQRISQTAGLETLYFLHDALGSVVGVANQSGVIVDSTIYSSFGQRLAGQETTEFGFTGELQIEDEGLVYLRDRYYDPNIGRFVSRDRFPGFVGDPISQNAYVYASNRPTSATDPTGFFTVNQILVGSAVSVSLGVGIRTAIRGGTPIQIFENVGIAFISSLVIGGVAVAATPTLLAVAGEAVVFSAATGAAGGAIVNQSLSFGEGVALAAADLNDPDSSSGGDVAAFAIRVGFEGLSSIFIAGPIIAVPVRLPRPSGPSGGTGGGPPASGPPPVPTVPKPQGGTPVGTATSGDIGQLVRSVQQTGPRNNPLLIERVTEGSIDFLF